jgi:hypothetical protein
MIAQAKQSKLSSRPESPSDGAEGPAVFSCVASTESYRKTVQ